MPRVTVLRAIGIVAVPALLGVVLVTPHQRQSGGARDSTSTRTSSQHGLTGYYYGNWGPNKVDWGEFSLPAGGAHDPLAVRVDPQIAFGRGKGFGSGSLGQDVVWWPGDSTKASAVAAVIWKGYLRLPKAGTFYLTTAYRGTSSAVYLNGARVSLNTMGSKLGGVAAVYGGYLGSTAFTYRDPGIGPSGGSDFGRRSSYAIPVTISTPRVVPIEVRFAMSPLGSQGIDLYWVTPDSPRDSSGRQVAELVPSEALYVDAPDEIPRSPVSGAHSTIAADFLYVPADADTFATLTVRVADRSGAPLQGRVVRIGNLSSGGAGGNIEQPVQRTDRAGVAVARVRARPGDPEGVESHFFAVVQDDLVEVDQVAELNFGTPGQISFLPYSFAPYYDGKYFLVSPTPLVVGQPATITVPLTNRRGVPMELYISVALLEWNIGLTQWSDIGESAPFVLQPLETREATVRWTPGREAGHVCFRLNVWGREPARSATNSLPTAGSVQYVAVAAAGSSARSFARTTVGPFSSFETRQQNIGPVTSCRARCDVISPSLARAAQLIAGASTAPPRYFRLTLLEEINTVANALCPGQDEAYARLRHLQQEAFRIGDYPPTPLSEAQQTVLRGMASDIAALQREVCGSGAPCGAGNEPVDPANNFLWETAKDVAKFLGRGGFFGEDVKRGQGDADRASKIKKFQDQIRSATCIPGTLKQAIQDHRNKATDASCATLCAETSKWIAELTGDDGMRMEHLKFCMNKCDEK